MLRARLMPPRATKEKTDFPAPSDRSRCVFRSADGLLRAGTGAADLRARAPSPVVGRRLQRGHSMQSAQWRRVLLSRASLITLWAGGKDMPGGGGKPALPGGS